MLDASLQERPDTFTFFIHLFFLRSRDSGRDLGWYQYAKQLSSFRCTFPDTLAGKVAVIVHRVVFSTKLYEG